MTTAATAGYGTLLKIGDGGSPTETFTTVAEVIDITGPDLKGDSVDVTNHDSASGFKEKIVTLLDGGQVKITANFLPANSTQSYSTGILKDFYNRTKRNYKIVFSDTGATTWEFAAICIGFQPKAPVKNQLTVDITYEVTGAPTLA